jgi:hypothetical protein
MAGKVRTGSDRNLRAGCPENFPLRGTATGSFLNESVSPGLQDQPGYIGLSG